MINDVTKRFIEVYNRLITEKKVNGAKDFAKSIGVSTSMMTEISKGRSNVGVTALQNIVLLYEVDSHWLLTGKENAKEEKDNPIEASLFLDRIEKLSAENALLKKENEDLKESHKKTSRSIDVSLPMAAEPKIGCKEKAEKR